MSRPTYTQIDSALRSRGADEVDGEDTEGSLDDDDDIDDRLPELEDNARADRGTSLSSRHSESHPFDQDIRAGTNTNNSTVSSPTSATTTVGAGTSLANSLHVPNPAMRKSVSIPSALAGRAREFAAQSTRKFDRVLRGAHDHDADYVEDHVLETLDYESHADNENEIRIETSGALHTNYLMLLKILMMITIGFVTAMLMFVVSQGVSLIYTHKISATKSLVETNPAAAYFAFLFMNLGITAVASSLCAVVAPHARGGGVPYAISYLNGTNVNEYFSPRIVIVKTLALIFTISGGLTLGMEGPFVFIGGGVALLCSRAIDLIFPFLFIGRENKRKFGSVIRNIREERIFMAGGLAAGLAVAFDAPIAGVLFALEGSTTFLTVPVVLRIFGCAMFASFFNDLGHNNFSSEMINHNLIAPTPENETPPWAFSIAEVLPFTILGLIGGVMGAGATYLNIQISKWRHHAMVGNDWKTIGKQIAEIAIFSFTISTVWFVLPFIFGCRAVGPQCEGSEEGEIRCPQLHCNDGYYSDIGAFVYSSSDDIGRMLFDRSLSFDSDYRAAPLIVYGLAYWVLVSLIYGAFVPGGLFVPSIVVGGVYGRVFGELVKYLFPLSFINPGVYALLGAASMLGGFTRLALPVVLMLIELTGDATYLLPIMYTAMVGKFFADFLYGPLYPQHMAMEGIPTLTDNLNPVIASLTARDVMIDKSRLACMKSIERVTNIRAILHSSKRSMFPLITPSHQLVGLITRQSVVEAVRTGQSFTTAYEAAKFGGARDVKFANHKHVKQNYHDWHQSTLTHNDAIDSNLMTKHSEDYINLEPFADCGLITVSPTAPTQRLAAMFRRLGLSHLCITDSKHHFLGFVTRRCLIKPPLLATAEEQQLHGDAADIQRMAEETKEAVAQKVQQRHTSVDQQEEKTQH